MEARRLIALAGAAVGLYFLRGAHSAAATSRSDALGFAGVFVRGARREGRDGCEGNECGEKDLFHACCIANKRGAACIDSEIPWN